MTTKPYNSLLDERCMTLWLSPTGLSHIGSWFGEVQCGKVRGEGWKYDGLTSLRIIGRMSRHPQANRLCKQCAKGYEDVSDD